MFDPKWVRDHPDLLDRGLKRRGLPGAVQNLLSIDGHRRAIIRVLESWRERQNAVSNKIAQAKTKKDEATVQELMPEAVECKKSISTLEGEEDEISRKWLRALAELPNIPADDVPDGDATANKEHHQHGAQRKFAFKPKLHFEIGEALGLMDFETAAKLSGSRFVVLKGALARMERALAQFMLDVHTAPERDGIGGYAEVAPPLLVRDDVMFGTAQLPKFANDQFSTIPRHTSQKERVDLLKRSIAELQERNLKDSSLIEDLEGQLDYEIEIESDRLWLIPTAEVPLTNFVRESIVDEAKLPIRLTACTPSFRAEAGAAGKDTRGMIRQHQFTKVELVAIATPEQSASEHERMLANAEAVLKKLDQHYRVVTLAAGDLGFAAQKTYDIEVWLPGEGAYREISSVSNCGEFQARRMQARYRPKGDKHVRHVHTLNGSGVAVGRALIAVLENYQEADGSVVVPDALAPYMGGIKKIERAS